MTTPLLPAFTGTPELNRIYHTDALTLLRALPDASVDCVITDMPYGVTACEWDTVIDLGQWWREMKRVMKPRGAVVMTATQPFTSELVMSNRKWFRYEWVWHKNNSAGFALTLYRPLMTTESVLIFSKESHDYYPVMEERGVPRNKDGYSISDNYNIKPSKSKSKSKSNTYYPKNLIAIGNASQFAKRHPTQKPVALMEYLIRTYTLPSETILDPFMGSGTTAIAARNLGRNFIGSDITAEYVELARERLQRTDPYQHTSLSNGMTQLSLFGDIS